MIRRWAAEALLDYLAGAPIQRGKYRLAQLASLILDGVPVQSCYGPRLKSRFSDSTFWLATRYGNQEVIDLLADLGPNDGFVDVGANIGLTTCFASPRCSAVLALEASPREFIHLLGNCALLGTSTRPICLLAAAAAESGFLPFRIGHISHSGGNSISSTFEGGNDEVTVVPSVSLDQLLNASSLAGWQAMLAAYQAKQIVVKIDVEGFESLVLSGMVNLLREKRLRKVIVEVNPKRADLLKQGLNVDQLMASYGYSPTILSAGRDHFDQCYLPSA
jgi:FkbM family methyltransferase